MGNKKLNLFDISIQRNLEMDDASIHCHNFDGKCFNGGSANFVDRATGLTIFEEEWKDNKVTVAGSQFTASKHWNIKPSVWTPSYNTKLRLDDTVTEEYSGKGIRPEESIFLFCVGTGGAGKQGAQVLDVDPTKWISPDQIIPFRYQLKDNDISASLKRKYFGRKVTSERIAYYFKAFETNGAGTGCVTFKQGYTDGTPMDENVYNIEKKGIQSYAEIILQISKEDCRDFFAATTGLDEAKINSISLCTAWAKEVDGQIVYQDIRPLTRLNFPTELLTDRTKGIDIIYHLYY